MINPNSEQLFIEGLEQDEFDSDSMARGGLWRFSISGALLRSQGAILRDLKNARHLRRYITNLNLVAILFSSAYGAVLGMFEPGLQIAYAAAKLPIVVVGTGLLCAPSLYVFNSILGSRLSFVQTLGLVGMMTSSASMILIAFAPISGFFTLTTHGVLFLAFLHGAVFLIGLGFAVRTLEIARRYLNFHDESRMPLHLGVAAVWLVVVLLVALQMGYYLRPFIEALPGHRFYTGERGLFLDSLFSTGP